MSGPTLSRYTPSVMAADLLERLFVARDRVLDEVVRRVDAATSSVERNHTLLVGPRGAGKTHLVALVYHRVKAMGAVQVAWLPEDPWTIVSYRHLLAEVCARLEPPVDGEVPRSVDDLERLLHDRASAGGPIVVVAENLDQILRSLGDEGQQHLRHLLQDERSLLLVATSTTLDRSLSDQASPFYGFFTTTRLEPFSVAEAQEMLTAIARERGDERLVEYLASKEGEARLRTIEHLAGGQPRMWATLASALTVEGLDDLVDLLLTGFDDLTPYYQEQLARLSGHQRLVVAELAEADRPLTVKDLAERLEIDQRSVGKTVSDLADRRWIAEIDSPVTALLDKRRTYYELAEPMARLSFQIKDTRGEPLRLVVDFLTLWFDPLDLRLATQVDQTVRWSTTVLGYIDAALSDSEPESSTMRWLNLPSAPGTRSVATLGQVDDALAAIAQGDADPFLSLQTSVRKAVEHRLAGSGVGEVRVMMHEAALETVPRHHSQVVKEWTRRAENLAAAAQAPDVASRRLLAQWLGRRAKFRSAIAVVAAIGVDGSADGAVDRLLARADLVQSLLARGKLTRAAGVLDQAASDADSIGRLDEVADSLRSIARDARRLEGRVGAASAAALGGLSGAAVAVAVPQAGVAVAMVAARFLLEAGRLSEANAHLARVRKLALESLGPDDLRSYLEVQADEEL